MSTLLKYIYRHINQETCLITLKDIKINNGSINIYGKGNSIFLKRYRSVYIDIPDVIDSIKSYLQIRNQSQSKALFCSWEGFPLKSGAIISTVKKLAAKANIQRNVTPMLIRHTFCSNITVNGADPFSVRELMGHKKIHTTLHYYTHFNQNQLKSQMLNFNPLKEGKY